MSRMNVAAVAAALVLVLMPTMAQAQTLTACYVPKSGSVYRIKAQGTPTACKPSHVEFSWEGTAPGYIAFHTTGADAHVVAPGTTAELVRFCGPGEQLMTGGYTKVGDATSEVEVKESHPGAGMERWYVKVQNHGASEAEVLVWTRCFILIPHS